MAWNVSAQQGTTLDVYTDTVNGSTILVSVTGPGSANAANLQINLTSDSAGQTPIAITHATISPTTSKSLATGEVASPLTITITDPTVGDVYLNIRNAAGTEGGTAQLTTYVLSPTNLKADPEVVKETIANIEVSTTLELHGGGPLPASIPLHWQIVSPAEEVYSQILQPAVQQDSQTVTQQTEYSMKTKGLTTYDLDQNGNGTVDFTLKLGDKDRGMQVGDGKTKTEITLGLLAPTCEPYFSAIDDQTQSLYKGSGYPFVIPIAHSMEKDDTIFLYAYDPKNDPLANTKWWLAMHKVKNKEAGTMIPLWVAVETPPLNISGTWDIAYRYIKATSGNLAYSDPLELTVKLKNQDPRIANPDKNLTPPRAVPQPYDKADYDQSEDMHISIVFNGALKPSAGDSVQPFLHLVGNTSGNLNQIYERAVPAPYLITQTDIDANDPLMLDWPNLAAGRQTITAADLENIDGSNGVAAYTYIPADTQLPVSSPGQPMSVDTVAPYSNPPEAALEIEKLRREILERHGKK